MTIYLAIISTLLAITQIIRVIQNSIQLYHINKEYEKQLAWIKDYDITNRYFDIQRDVFYMLYAYLIDIGYGEKRPIKH